MKQNYGFKDIYAVQYDLAKPNRIQLQGLKPIDSILKDVDKKAAKVEKKVVQQKKVQKANAQRKFDNSINSVFGRSPLFK